MIAQAAFSFTPNFLHVSFITLRNEGRSSSLKSMTNSCCDLCMPPLTLIVICTLSKGQASINKQILQLALQEGNSPSFSAMCDTLIAL